MSDPTLIDKSETSESSNVTGKNCSAGRFITEYEGRKIVDIAATWIGTPYDLIGAKSEKGKKETVQEPQTKYIRNQVFRIPIKPVVDLMIFR